MFEDEYLGAGKKRIRDIAEDLGEKKSMSRLVRAFLKQYGGSDEHTVSLFPNLVKLANIALVVAVTSANAERSFSTVRAIFTKLRNSLSDSMLDALVRIYSFGKEISNDELGTFLNRAVIAWHSIAPRRCPLIVVPHGRSSVPTVLDSSDESREFESEEPLTRRRKHNPNSIKSTSKVASKIRESVQDQTKISGSHSSCQRTRSEIELPLGLDRLSSSMLFAHIIVSGYSYLCIESSNNSYSSRLWPTAVPGVKIYHELQSGSDCGFHAPHNVLGFALFDRKLSATFRQCYSANSYLTPHHIESFLIAGGFKYWNCFRNGNFDLKPVISSILPSPSPLHWIDWEYIRRHHTQFDANEFAGIVLYRKGHYLGLRYVHELSCWILFDSLSVSDQNDLFTTSHSAFSLTILTQANFQDLLLNLRYTNYIFIEKVDLVATRSLLEFKYSNHMEIVDDVAESCEIPDRDIPP